jgi:predicted amidophosphoribosyltransferase
MKWYLDLLACFAATPTEPCPDCGEDMPITYCYCDVCGRMLRHHSS